MINESHDEAVIFKIEVEQYQKADLIYFYNISTVVAYSRSDYRFARYVYKIMDWTKSTSKCGASSTTVENLLGTWRGPWKRGRGLKQL